jgi:hypothetical protein
MRRLLTIAVICTILLPSAGCAVLLDTVLNMLFDTDSDLPSHATEGMSDREAARAEVEYDNVNSLSD